LGGKRRKSVAGPRQADVTLLSDRCRRHLNRKPPARPLNGDPNGQQNRQSNAKVDQLNNLTLVQAVAGRPSWYFANWTS